MAKKKSDKKEFTKSIRKALGVGSPSRDTAKPAAKKTVKKVSAKQKVSPAKKRPAPVKDVRSRLSQSDFENRVRERAYLLFEERGYSHNNDWNDWFQAERLVKLELGLDK